MGTTVGILVAAAPVVYNRGMTSSTSGFVFDFDGTLHDSVYQHVIAWQRAFADIGLDVALWRVHRRVGMSGSLLAARVAAETGHQLTEADKEKVEDLHTRYYADNRDAVRPLPGARELLLALSEADIAWVIATSGAADEALPLLEQLELPDKPPIITSDEVSAAKPSPPLFVAAAGRLGVEAADCLVVGDTVWDILAARRSGMLGIGLLSGGIARADLLHAGALRIYADPADLHDHLDEVGVTV